MAKFNVEVTLTACCTYTVEIEAESDGAAENDALKLWRDKLPEDFQVEKGYIERWDTEVEQLTWECEECGTGITRERSSKSGGLCALCDAKMEAEDRSAQP